MRQVNIRKLRSNLATELKDLPFEVVRKGVVVAVVDHPDLCGEGGYGRAVSYSREHLEAMAKHPVVESYFNPMSKDRQLGKRRGESKKQPTCGGGNG